MRREDLLERREPAMFLCDGIFDSNGALNVVKIRPPMVFSKTNADWLLEKLDHALGGL